MCQRVPAIVAVLVVSACSLSRPPVDPANYYLSAVRDAPTLSVGKPITVRVAPLRTAPIYDRKELVYRLDGERVVSDFYHGFAEHPDTMITAAVTEWLRRAQLFKAVVEPRLAIDTPYTLDGTIVALFGDFQDAAAPAAVLGIHFYLVRANSNGREIVLDRMLQERVTVSARTAQALVQGYNDALARILSRLEEELARLELT